MVDIPLSPRYVTNTYMVLSESMVRALLPLLKNFAETGRLPPVVPDGS